MTPNENAPGAGGDPAVDFDQLRAASGEDLALLKELVDLYFGQAQEIMVELNAAMSKSSAEDVDYFAHKLVGASLACGMSVMVAPLRELESRGRKGDLTGAEIFLGQVTTNLEIVRAAVTEFLRDNPTL